MAFRGFGTWKRAILRLRRGVGWYSIVLHYGTVMGTDDVASFMAFIGYDWVAQEPGLKLTPKNSPMIQCDTTLTHLRTILTDYWPRTFPPFHFSEKI